MLAHTYAVTVVCNLYRCLLPGLRLSQSPVSLRLFGYLSVKSNKIQFFTVFLNVWLVFSQFTSFMKINNYIHSGQLTSCNLDDSVASLEKETQDGGNVNSQREDGPPPDRPCTGTGPCWSQTFQSRPLNRQSLSLVSRGCCHLLSHCWGNIFQSRPLN